MYCFSALSYSYSPAPPIATATSTACTASDSYWLVYTTRASASNY